MFAISIRARRKSSEAELAGGLNQLFALVSAGAVIVIVGMRKINQVELVVGLADEDVGRTEVAVSDPSLKVDPLERFYEDASAIAHTELSEKGRKSSRAGERAALVAEREVVEGLDRRTTEAKEKQ